MNGPYFGERNSTSDFVVKTDQESNTPLVNSDPFADKVPVDPALMHETPMGGTVAAVGPMNETVVHEAPSGETTPNKIPLGETTAYEAEVSKPLPYMATASETIAHKASISPNVGSVATLLDREVSDHFRTRWNEIQGKFVDEPRTAVQLADALVSEVVENITQMFAKEHSSLEGQWNQGNEVSTEDLRMALQRYRSFFNRLVV